MVKNYIIRAPFVVRLDAKNIHQSGEVIALDDAVAAMHAHKLVEVKAEAKQRKELSGDNRKF